MSSKAGRLCVAALVSIFMLGSIAAPAKAGVAEEISALPTLDALTRAELPLWNGGKWAPLGWVSGSATGRDTSLGWGPFESYPVVNGAAWTPTPFGNAKTGSAAAITTVVSAGALGHVSLWLDMPNPTTKSGYQLRWVLNPSTGVYTVKLLKWVAGVETVLASNPSVSLPSGTTLAISDTGETVTAWQGPNGGALTAVLAAVDSTYTGGYAGIEGSGNASRSVYFKAAPVALAGPAPDTTLTGGSAGTVTPAVTFPFKSSDPVAKFECSLDGGGYAGCASPRSYQGLSAGWHTFAVRAVTAAGIDPTPAERKVKVITPQWALYETPLRDNFEREEVPLATGNWGPTPWASGIGGVWAGALRGYGTDSAGNLSSAYWKNSVFSDEKSAEMVAATVGTGSTPAGEYVGLWLNMPSPTSARSGYEVRFTGTGVADTYKAELSRWTGGTRTVLALKEGVSLPVNSVFAMTYTGGSLNVWTGSQSSLTSLLQTIDTTYRSGYAGIEVLGRAGTYYNGKAGQVVWPPQTTIKSGPSGPAPQNVSFEFTGTNLEDTFECSLDTAAYSPCASPKAYSGLSTGAHAFKVRAVDFTGVADATPAERGFTVVQAPTVATASATAVKSNQATLNATVNPNGDATTYQFEYGTTTSYGSKAPATAKGVGSGSTSVEVGEPLSGLAADTTYHFRISATNAGGTRLGVDRTFTTVTAPVATTEAATDIAADKATLRATVNPKGLPTTYQFEYGPTTSYGAKIPVAATGVGSGGSGVPVSQLASGLTEGQAYHYRVVATNEIGTSYGADRSFSLPYLPDAVTEKSEAVDADEAVLTGSVDPNGSDTEYRFEYGKTTSYGSTAPAAEEEAGSGNVVAEASEPLTDLEPETTYHYRIVATSEAGTDLGADKALTTSARSVSAQREQEEEAEEQQYTAKFVAEPPGEFMGLMCCGEHLDREANVIMRSGAGMFRLYLDLNSNEAFVEQMFRQLSNRGIQVLPYFNYQGLTLDNLTGWKEEIKRKVAKYGPGGSFWKAGGGYGGSNPMPAIWWELGNEPNLGKNMVAPKVPYDQPAPGKTQSKIAEFGEIFQALSDSAKSVESAKNAGGVKILLPGLFTTGATGCGDQECHMAAGHFIKAMGHYSAYNAVSIHPYAFKAGTTGQAPTDDASANSLVKRIKANISGVKAALVGENQGKPIWITELGFPVASDKPETFPKVTMAMQAKLIEKSISMVKANRVDFNIARFFYFNIRDLNGATHPEWDWHTGLLAANGNIRRESWEAFARETKTGDPNWKPIPKNAHKSTSPRPKSAVASSVINPYGMWTEYWVKWGGGPALEPLGKEDKFENFSDPQGAGYEETDVEKQAAITGLQPKTTYHYRVVAENQDEQKTETPTIEFTTPPFISSEVKRVLHGQPGWVSVGGWETEVPGATVNVRFERDTNADPAIDSWEARPDKTFSLQVPANGYYETGYLSMGKGHWRAKTVFPAQSGQPQYESDWEGFNVRDGVQLVAKHSGKCLGVNTGSTATNEPIMHGECGAPTVAQHQVFTMVPEGGTYYHFVARHSGKCIDINQGSTADGAIAMQHECHGGTNQSFNEQWAPGSSFAAYVAKHSNKCLNVQNSSQSWANVLQWSCSGLANQAFQPVPVESAPVPTQTYLTIDQALHGSPGMVSVHGNLLAGAYSMQSRIVHVEFDNNDTAGWDSSGGDIAIPVASNGSYEYRDFGVPPGNWNIRARFVGNDEFAQSLSGTHFQTIKRGYQIINRKSGKCLSLSENKNTNGQAFIQWTCGSPPVNGNGQVFSFWPQGGGWYEIRTNGTNRCLDVAGANTADGTALQLWDCLGAGQYNQHWNRMPISGQPGWYALYSRHAGKCGDIWGASLADGAQALQWTCHWGGNQQWDLNGVISP